MLTLNLPSGSGPVVEGRVAVGWCEAGLVGRPEPAVQVLREEVGTVATIEVAETARSPEIRNVS